MRSGTKMRSLLALGPALVLTLAAGALCLAAQPALAKSWRTTASRHAAPVNTENNTTADSGDDGRCIPGAVSRLPFSVSVDGVPTGGAGLGVNADSQRCADLALDRADVQIRYDGLAAEPRLNVIATPDAALRGEGATFIVYANYGSHIDHAEVRIFAEGDTTRQQPLAVLPVDHGEAHWHVPAGRNDSLTYVVRVYDASGRLDESKPKTLKLADIRGGKSDPAEIAAVYDSNALEIHNIPVTGGAVTVSGTHLALGSQVHIMGAAVPVDRNGAFAYRTILSPGPHQVRVEIADPQGHVSEFTRSASIPDRDWFYVALADLTVGHGTASDNFALLNPDKADEFNNKTFVNGRLAFYLKGKIRGDTLLTASADTRDQPVSHLFTNFMSKDPHYLLRHLDPNKYYPVYGDDSSVTDDAPTNGKFYVRLERGDSHIMWGNFKTAINGSEFVRYDRGLYGAEAHVATDASTVYGEKRGEAEAFAAQPGTLGARDVFRGTGGSLYYLRRQNITTGSERVSVELRDEITGLVLQSKVLKPAEDYEVNAIQGRVLLREPLASTGTDDFVVHTGSLGGNAQYLVITYEFTPGLEQSEDKVAGGRASYWINDHIQVGASGYDQTQPGMAQKLVGADITVRYAPGTYVKFEGAQSDGAGSGESVSADGGFSFDTRSAGGERAGAKRVEAGVDLNEIAPGREGRLAGYWQEKDKGFSGPGNITAETGAREMGASADVKLGGPWSVKAKLTRKEDEYRNYSAGEGDVAYAVDSHWTVGVGVKLDSNDPVSASASPTLNQAGRRTDVGVKVGYDSQRDWSTYVFAQTTVQRTADRDSNNRAGVGGKVRLSSKLTANGEVSGGDGGIGGKIGTEYQINDASTAYLTYSLDPDHTDIISRGGEGMLVSGARTRFSDSVSVFGEERFRHGAGYGGLTHAFGLDFAPIKDWKTGFAFETGNLSDPNAGDIKRTAASVTLGFSREELNYAGKLEYRKDQTTTTTAETDRNTWLVNNALGVKVSKDWRFLGKFNGSWSDASNGDFYDGNYIEAVSGFAFRPVLNDRLNGLFKYTYLYDLPSPGQISSAGLTPDYAQASHVLSVDADYDVLSWLTLGGKYAFRFGALRDSRDASAEWFDSKAQLVIGRLDVHLNKSWDVVGEGRMLENLTAEDRKTGALVAIYRHINENFMVGGGYNFSDFSDNLTDLSTKSRGVFFNVVGKF